MDAPSTVLSEPRGYSRKRAAEALSVSERTLDRMLAAGLLKSAKVSQRRRIIPQTEISRILAAAI
jgi:predicted site-specific integrase-resolvase